MSTSSDDQQTDDSVLDDPPERLEQPGDDEGLNWYVVVGVLVTAAILGYLVVDGLGSETYFFTVDEAVAESESLVDETIRVKGSVVEGSIESDSTGVGKTFEISADGESLKVVYDEAAPDTFEDGVEVVATGTLEASGTLKADELLVKCPSRYEGDPPTAGEGEKGPRAER